MAWRYDGSLENAAKNRGRPFLGFERGAHRLCGRPTCRLTLDSPLLTLCSPARGVSARKSGVGRGEWKVSSTQNFVVLTCQAYHDRSLASTLYLVSFHLLRPPAFLSSSFHCGPPYSWARPGARLHYGLGHVSIPPVRLSTSLSRRCSHLARTPFGSSAK
jgi:hypothetical protein